MDTPKTPHGDRQNQFQGYQYKDDPYVQVAKNYLAHIQRNFDTIFQGVFSIEHERKIFRKVIDGIQSSQDERYETRWPFPAQQPGEVVTETKALHEAVSRVIGWIADAGSSLSGAVPTHEIIDILIKYQESAVFEKEYEPKS
jgi:hypothetical protein